MTTRKLDRSRPTNAPSSVRSAPRSQHLPPTHPVAELQSTVGNRVVNRMLGAGRVRIDSGKERDKGYLSAPGTLDKKTLNASIAFNQKKLAKKSSVIVIQNLVGIPKPSGRFDEQTILAIDRFQSDRKLADIEGRIGEFTLEAMAETLEARGQQDEVIHLLMDYYHMKDYGALVEIRYNRELWSDGATTPVEIPGPSEVEIGPSAFSYFAYLVHTIAHELEHVRQFKEGLTGPSGEFLAEARNILSVGLPPRRFPDFMDDAERAFNEGWRQMSMDERLRLAKLFQRVRRKVLERFQEEFHYFRDHLSAERFRATREKYRREGAGGAR